MTVHCDHLFVYGTLRRDSGHHMHQVLARDAEFIDHASFRGRMFLVARYPGVVESDEKSDRIVGDVFRLRATSADLLRRLDRYEACDPRNPEAPYIRAIRRVTLDSGEVLDAWVYLYRRSTTALARIANGDFLAR